MGYIEIVKNKRVIIGEDVYEIRNYSYEDDYGSWAQNYVAYKNGVRITPTNYRLDSWDAEAYIPHKKEKCPCCGHEKVLPLQYESENVE